MTISKETIKTAIEKLTQSDASIVAVLSSIFSLKSTKQFEHQIDIPLSAKTVLAIERESGVSTILSEPGKEDEEWELFLAWSDKHGLIFQGEIPAADHQKAVVGIPSRKEYFVQFMIDAKTGVIISARDIAEV